MKEDGLSSFRTLHIGVRRDTGGEKAKKYTRDLDGMGGGGDFWACSGQKNHPRGSDDAYFVIYKSKGFIVPNTTFPTWDIASSPSLLTGGKTLSDGVKWPFSHLHWLLEGSGEC